MGENYLSILRDNITYSLRHANYDRTIEVKSTCRKFVIGKGREHDAEVTRYKRFEEDALKNQRINLTNAPTPSLISRLRKFWKQMARIEGIRRDVQITKATDVDRLAILQNSFHNFLPGEDLETYQNRMLEYLGVTDPNAWILYERYDRRNVEGTPIETKVYPVVWGSENVINYQKTYGILDWIIFRSARIGKEKKLNADTFLEDFYIYGIGKVAVAREVSEGMSKSEEEQEWIITPEGGSTRTFYVREYQNGTKEVPAECVGVYFDEETGHETFVPWFKPGEFVLNDIIRAKSTSDVLQTIYANPRIIRFVRSCKFVHPEMGQCEGGYYAGIQDDLHRCEKCSGTGIPKGYTTEQAVIEIVLPDVEPDKILDLSRLSYTEQIDHSLLAWYDTKISELERRFMSTVFPSGLYQETNGTQVMTATQVNAIMQGISDVLAPFGLLDSRHYEKAYRVGAQYLEFGITVNKSYPEDLQINLLSEVLEDFNTIKTSGVGYEATLSQRRRVFQKLFEGEPESQKAIAARYKYLPFDDKTPEQVSLIVSRRADDDPDYILWSNWKDIFEQIESIYPEFYKFSAQQQKKIVDATVAEFREKIRPMGLAQADIGAGAVDDSESENNPSDADA